MSSADLGGEEGPTSDFSKVMEMEALGWRTYSVLETLHHGFDIVMVTC